MADAGPLLLAALLAAAAPAAAQVTVHARQPRPYGYVVGDLLTQRFTLQVAPPYRLDPASLPRQGRVGVWFERRAVALQEPLAPGGALQLDVTYQVVNAPTEVQTLTLPAAALRFSGPAGAVEEALPEWPVTVSPITPETVLARAGLDTLQPDRPPPLADPRPLERRLAVSLAGAGAIGGWLLLRLLGSPLLASGRRPFAVACRELRRQARHREAPEAALRSLHRAFDRTAGHTVFGDQLDAFFARHPAFAAAEQDIRRFYAASRARFFGGGEAAPADIDLRRLAARCRRIEREAG